MSATSFLNDRIVLHPGNCLDVLKTLADSSIDSCVTDPPYHLTSIVKRFGADNAAPAKVGKTGAYARASRGFMGKTWDGGDVAFQPETWAEVLRVLKPGAHLIAFSGTRTYHKMACAIEDAGFEIRDQLAWVYGTGFPKSHDVSKAIDKAAGATREVVGSKLGLPGMAKDGGNQKREAWRALEGRSDEPQSALDITAPATPEAAQWAGWGTALKPAWEPIVLARKPLAEGTVAANVLAHGTGAINVGGCRIEAPEGVAKIQHHETGAVHGYSGGIKGGHQVAPSFEGRFPANLLHDGSPEVLAGFPQTTSGGAPSAGDRNGDVYGQFGSRSLTNHGANSGSAARFFFSAKAGADDRLASRHPTVKPVDLMQWLVRLVTPKSGICLDPFAGTGTTGEAAWREGMRAVLIEREVEYLADISRRMALCLAGPEERARAIIKADQERRGAVAEHGPLFEGIC